MELEIIYFKSKSFVIVTKWLFKIWYRTLNLEEKILRQGSMKLEGKEMDIYSSLSQGLLSETEPTTWLKWKRI